jgi:lipopolysaccharide/colanic/teichoic acid biosynthesis glycosyltransferase
VLSRQLQQKVKYSLDRLVAAVLLALASPVALLVAAAIKLDSRGPVFFCQPRVGLGGRRFTIYKFRSMAKDADALLDERGCACGNRITRVGRLLRLSSLDELPQLINIVRGEMSFIGPRPILMDRHERCTQRQRRRCEMKPGVTGLAQVSGRNTVPWSRRLELDVQYIEQYSWRLDVRILFRTALVVFSGAGLVLDRNPDQVDDMGGPVDANAGTDAGGETDSLFRRIEPAFVGAYRKDADYEEFLRCLNHSLAENHDRELQDLPEIYPTIHVIGAPRSGTTLLTQLIASCLDVGYINHLIAAFWRVPCYGIRLSGRLLTDTRAGSYRSDFGRTSSIDEPHEFGYFWSYMLGYRNMEEQDGDFESHIDWHRLRRTLVNMAQEFGKPALFKSFLLAWHIRKMQQILPKSVFVWVRRDPVDNALSLLKARQAQLGSIDEWISMKPREYSWLRHEPVCRQVAGQVYYLERAIERQVDAVGGRNVLQIAYSEMCVAPREVLKQVCDLLERNGSTVQCVGEVPEHFERQTGGDTDHVLRERIASALNDFSREAEHGRSVLRRVS